MRKGFIAKALLGFALLAATATTALAVPVRFNFTFASGAATATGYITLESTLVNPGAGGYVLPNPAVLDLQVTVAGAAAGNGTFGIGSFTNIIFDTAGSVLNFTQELVGQTAGAGLWGTTAGDFNLFGAAPAPNGVIFYTLGANGGAADAMVLVNMTPVVPQIPTLGEWMLVLLALMVGGAGYVIIRRGPSARLSG